MFFFFKQKTAYEMRISDWSSDVCSSDLKRITASESAFAAFSVIPLIGNIRASAVIAILQILSVIQRIGVIRLASERGPPPKRLNALVAAVLGLWLAVMRLARRPRPRPRQADRGPDRKSTRLNSRN